MARLVVQQHNQFYVVYTPQGIKIAQIFMGQDGQYARDVVTLKPIIKALSLRWGITTSGK